MGVGVQRHTLADLPPGKTLYPSYRRLGGPQSRSRRVRKISPPPGFDPRTVHPVASRYTDWANRAGQLHALASLPPGKTRYPLYRRLGGPRGRSGRVRKISPPPGFDPRTVQPAASRYTDWANPAQNITGFLF